MSVKSMIQCDVCGAQAEEPRPYERPDGWYMLYAGKWHPAGWSAHCCSTECAVSWISPTEQPPTTESGNNDPRF